MSLFSDRFRADRLLNRDGLRRLCERIGGHDAIREVLSKLTAGDFLSPTCYSDLNGAALWGLREVVVWMVEHLSTAMASSAADVLRQVEAEA